jgi:hypothetical protein
MGALEEVVAARVEMEGPAVRVGVALCPAKAVPAAREALVIRQASMALQVRTVHTSTLKQLDQHRTCRVVM